MLVTRFPFPDPQPFGLMLMPLSEGRSGNVALERWGGDLQAVQAETSLVCSLGWGYQGVEGRWWRAYCMRSTESPF